MKKGQIIFLLILLGILVLLVWLKKSQVPEEVASEEFSAVVVSLDATQAQSLEMRKGSDEASMVRVVKNGETWSMPARWNMPVKKEKIDSALGMLKQLKGELRGSDKAFLGDFGITDEGAYHVIVKGADDKEFSHFLVGTERPRYSSSFVRQHGSDHVYLVDYNLAVTFAMGESAGAAAVNERSWLDLSVGNFDPQTVTGVRIERRGDEGMEASLIELLKTPDVESGRGRWSFTQTDLPFGTDAGKVSDYLNSILNLKGSDFHDPTGTTYGFENFYLEIKLDAAEEQNKCTITIGAKVGDTDSRYVRTTGAEPVLSLPDYSLSQLGVEASYFFPSNPLGIDKEKLASVSVHKPSGDRKADQENFDKEEALLNALRDFSVARLLPVSESKKVKAGGEQWLEIVPKEGEPILVDVGEPLGEEQTEYAGALRNGTRAFAISKDTYRNLFEA